MSSARLELLQPYFRDHNFTQKTFWKIHLNYMLLVTHEHMTLYLKYMFWWEILTYYIILTRQWRNWAPRSVLLIITQNPVFSSFPQRLDKWQINCFFFFSTLIPLISLDSTEHSRLQLQWTVNTTGHFCCCCFKKKRLPTSALIIQLRKAQITGKKRVKHFDTEQSTLAVIKTLNPFGNLE